MGVCGKKYGWIALLGLVACGVQELDVVSRSVAPSPVEAAVVLTGPTSGESGSCLGEEDFSAVHGTAGGIAWFVQKTKLWGTTTGAFPLHMEYQNKHAQLEHVVALAPNEAWAVGAKRTQGQWEGLLLRWNGKVWEEADVCLDAGVKKGVVCGGVKGMLGAMNLTQLFGIDEDLWLVGFKSLEPGAKRSVWKSQAGLWKEEFFPVDMDDILSLWGASRNDVWAVGGKGLILKWDGTRWARQSAEVTSNLQSVWGMDALNVWAVGDAGTILRWNGAGWKRLNVEPARLEIKSIWGIDTDNMWAAGGISGIATPDKESPWNWKITGKLNDIGSYLQSVWGEDKSRAWAVGTRGSVARWDGTQWSWQTSCPLGK